MYIHTQVCVFVCVKGLDGVPKSTSEHFLLPG